MAETPDKMKTICFGCLAKNDENTLDIYTIQSEILKELLQIDHLCLCIFCRKLAQRAELFIQTVQTNQLLLENFHSVTDSALEIIRLQTQPLIHLTEHSQSHITVSDEHSNTNNSCNKDLKVKLEVKEEELDHLEGEFVDDDDADFHPPFVKEEDEAYELNNLLHGNIDSVTARKHIKKKKIKQKEKYDLKNGIKDKPKIEIIHITKQQCLDERAEMSLDKKYTSSRYKCEYCIKGFNVKTSYDQHMEKHSEKRQLTKKKCRRKHANTMGDFQCDICKLRMNSDEKLQTHRKYHQIRYKCGECDLTRICRITIKDHYSAFHCSGYYQCPHCLKDFKRSASLRKHIMYQHRPRERVTCAYCNKSYASRDVLKAHLNKCHPIEVSHHETIKPYACKECGMTFSCPSHLKKHVTKHSDRRDYYCVECNKSFKTVYILKHHLKTATPHIKYLELPYGCDHCDKRFPIRRDLDRHKNSIHLNVKPYQCDKCDKAYVNDWSLMDHKRRIHEGYRRPLRFSCPMCDKVFDRNQILKGHLRTHTGERPYQCSKCPAKFSQSSILGTHMKLIHLKLTRDGRPKGVAMK